MAPITFSSNLFPRAPSSQVSNLLSSPATSFTTLRSTTTTPTRTTPNLISRTLQLLSRQTTDPAIIPTTYGSINSGPSAGTIVGIVLGSVGGFLLLLWLIYTCLNFGTMSDGSTYTESIHIARERRRNKSHRSSQRSRRSASRSETVEIRRPPVVVPMPMPMPRREPERVERVVVEESRQTRRERVPESSVGSDEVVVIEEHHEEPRRKKSQRNSGGETGYRTVDPGTYGGVVGGKGRRGSGARR